MPADLIAARTVVLNRDGWSCVVCGNRHDEVHHRFRRGMGGSKDPDIHAPWNLLCLCRAHHREAESERAYARHVTGLCVPSLTLARVTPVRTGLMGWALPSAGGTWLPICAASAAADQLQAHIIAARCGLLDPTDRGEGANR
jgi:hypothetical protein